MTPLGCHGDTPRFVRGVSLTTLDHPVSRVAPTPAEFAAPKVARSFWLRRAVVRRVPGGAADGGYEVKWVVPRWYKITVIMM